LGNWPIVQKFRGFQSKSTDFIEFFPHILNSFDPQ
jgi:hypothetical protein